MTSTAQSNRGESGMTQQLPREMLQVKIEPEFGHRVLTARIKPLLEKYRQSSASSCRDKTVCAELLRAIDICDQINNNDVSTSQQAISIVRNSVAAKARPKTAIPVSTNATRFSQDYDESEERNRFMTTYGSNFTAHVGEKLAAAARPFTPKRPMSSYPYTVGYNIGDPIGTTTYDYEFNRVTSLPARDRERPIRAGSTSGNRRNNPHPSESFMVWRAPRERSANHNHDHDHEGRFQQVPKATGHYFPTNEDVQRIYEPLRVSTYRQDYERSALAAQAIREALHEKARSTENGDSNKSAPARTVPYCTYTTQRSAFAPIGNVDKALRTSTTRFGSNSSKSHYCCGITPTANSEVRLNMKTRTHYDEDVNDRAVKLYEEIGLRSTVPRGKCVRRPPSTIMPDIPVDSY